MLNKIDIVQEAEEILRRKRLDAELSGTEELSLTPSGTETHGAETVTAARLFFDVVFSVSKKLYLGTDVLCVPFEAVLERGLRAAENSWRRYDPMKHGDPDRYISAMTENEVGEFLAVFADEDPQLPVISERTMKIISDVFLIK